MRIFYEYLNAASTVNYERYGEPLIDEGLYIVMDDGMRYMLNNPDATSEEARTKGAFRVTNPMEYDGEAH